ncbi:MAG: DUF898 family protein [Pseudomonadota bacterium]
MSDDFDPIPGRYTGSTGGLFWLVVRTSLLTALTLGLYRFWARTRVRRYVWSATSPGGDPFEYTGTGLEKLLGFLIAIVVLAVVLGLFQMGLFYLGVSLFNDAGSDMEFEIQMALFQLTALLLFPLIYFAQYRSRRYKMSRTRWRGIRFGMENGAAGYMWRAIGHSIVTGLTFGLLLPRQTFYLARYKINRSWYGNAKFVLMGHWSQLYPAMLHLLIGVAIFVLSMALTVFVGPFGMFGVVLGYVWWMIGFVHYRVASYAFLTENTILGDDIRFGAVPSTGAIMGKIIVGGILVGILGALAFAGLGGVAAVTGVTGPLSQGDVDSVPLIGAAASIVGLIFVVVLYGALATVFIVQPITAHLVEHTAVLNPDELRRIRQRQGEEQVDADGFADALDVGGAF